MRKVLEKHIKENIKEYFIFALILVIGLFIGTLFLNNSSDIQKQEITEFVQSFNQELKEGYKLDYSKMLFEIFQKDIKLVILITFLSISIIGVPALYLIIGYKGFSLGYTIASISLALGTGKGLMFSVSLMLLSKMLEIPAIFFLILSGMKMYKMIIKDRSKENIMYSIRRFAFNMLISVIILIISALIETYLSTNLFLSILKYF